MLSDPSVRSASRMVIEILTGTRPVTRLGVSPGRAQIAQCVWG